MYKAIFMDVDGTIRDSKRILKKRTIEAIKKVSESGIIVVLCSGRPRKYTEDISKKCHASRYIITSNGGEIYDYQEKKVMYASVMDKKACLELYKIAQKADIRYIMNVGDRRTVNKLHVFDGSEVKLKIDIETFLKENDVIQCTLADSKYETIKNLRQDIEKVKNIEIKNLHKSLINSNYPKRGTIYYDIANCDSCKGVAVKKLCEILNIDLKDVIAMGDSDNDLSMFDIVGHSVAMGNANENVKRTS